MPAVLCLSSPCRRDDAELLGEGELGYAEFSEAIIRLYEEKRGVLQQDLDFDLSNEEEETSRT